MRTVLRHRSSAPLGASDSPPAGCPLEKPFALFRLTPVLLSLVLIVSATRDVTAQENSSPENFVPIGIWFEGNPTFLGISPEPTSYRDYLDSVFSGVARIGLNCITAVNIRPEHADLLLEAAATHNLKVILEVAAAKGILAATPAAPEINQRIAQETAARYGYSRVLSRYQVLDSPPEKLLPAWLAINRAFAAADPTHPVFASFQTPESLKAVQVTGALNEAVFYIFSLEETTETGDFSAYRDSLAQFVEASGSLPPWAVLQAFAKPGVWRYPESVELRYMTYHAIAKGVKGFFFFIYQSLPNHPERLEGLVDSDLVPLPIYGEVQRLARRLGEMQGTISQMEPVQPFARVPEDVDAGFFQSQDGTLCLAVVNRDLKNSRYVPVRLADWVRPIPNRVTDEATQSTVGFHWDSGPPSTRVLLGPGEGTILRFWREAGVR